MTDTGRAHWATPAPARQDAIVASRGAESLRFSVSPLRTPSLDAVVVERIDPAIFAQLRLARLYITGFVQSARLQQQLAAVPIEFEIKARQGFVPYRTIDLRGAPVAPAIEGDVDTRDLAAAGPSDSGQDGKSGFVSERRLRTGTGDPIASIT
jgi:hypothetical protein